MDTVVTAKLKLHTTPDQFRALRATQLAYRDALNYVSRYAFAHGKMSNTLDLQEGTYQDIRSRFGLPAQMACSVPRQVGPPIRRCGPRRRPMLLRGQRVIPRSSTRAWTSLPSTSRRR
jgi:predicted transposase